MSAQFTAGLVDGLRQALAGRRNKKDQNQLPKATSVLTSS